MIPSLSRVSGYWPQLNECLYIQIPKQSLGPTKIYFRLDSDKSGELPQLACRPSYLPEWVFSKTADTDYILRTMYVTFPARDLYRQSPCVTLVTHHQTMTHCCIPSCWQSHTKWLCSLHCLISCTRPSQELILHLIGPSDWQSVPAL